MAFYLAMDVGGTKTEYVLADEDRELARVRGGSIKRMRVDAATASSNLDAALRELTQLTGIIPQAIRCTCAGAAGYTVPMVADWIRTAVHERVSGHLLLVGDVEIALDAAFFGGPGVLVMAGTGSNVAGRSSDGQLITAGGWGPALADQASGHRIGAQALRGLFLAMDEGRSSTLLAGILDLWQLSDIAAIVSYANQIPSPDVTQLAPLVGRCALEGDELAQSLLRTEGEELAHLVAVVIRRLQRLNGSGDWLPEVAFTGSILEHVAPVRTAIARALGREFPALTLLPGVIDPLAGALWRARKSCGGEMGSSREPMLSYCVEGLGRL